MTKLLEKAIARVRELPEAEQDKAAEILFAVASQSDEPVELDERTLAAVREGREQARRGKFASEEEIAALFKRPKA